MTTRVLRAEIPIDDREHELSLDGPIVLVAARQANTVEIWWHSTGEDYAGTTFRVFGTGHTIPAFWTHVGSVLSPEVVLASAIVAPRGAFVWHLFSTPTGARS